MRLKIQSSRVCSSILVLQFVKRLHLMYTSVLEWLKITEVDHKRPNISVHVIVA